MNRAERMVKSQGEMGPKRVWFQTHSERMDEKERFKLGGISQDAPAEGGRFKKKKKGENQKAKREQKNKERKKAKKSSEMSAEERAQSELQKVMLMQARAAKKSSKPKTMRLSNDVDTLKDKRVLSAKKKGISLKNSTFFSTFNNNYNCNRKSNTFGICFCSRSGGYEPDICQEIPASRQ